MVEGQVVKAVWWWLAYGGCVAGFGWWALTLESHWQQVRRSRPPAGPRLRCLRGLGAVALVLSLGACLRADHVGMAALVWVMMLAAAALTVTFALSWRPRLLLPLTLVVPADATHRPR